MSNIVRRAGLLASAVLLCASSGSLQAADQPTSVLGLPSFEGKTTLGTNAVNIESTMLTATAVDGAADRIAKMITVPAGRDVLVLGVSDTVDFSQVAMIQTEMHAIQRQLAEAAKPEKNITEMVIPPTAIIPALAGLLRSDVEITGTDVSFDARVLPGAVAAHLGSNAKLLSAAVGANTKSTLLQDFDQLCLQAAAARGMHDEIADKDKPTPAEKRKLARLKAALDRFDDFYARVTKANDKGVVPLAAAARLAQLAASKPLVLRVITEKAGGTTVKRTNLLTFFGADPVSISGGLVASYQLSDPELGVVTASGVVTCRTAITKLGKVQDGSWKPSGQTPGPDGPKAICQAVGFQVPPPSKENS